MKTHHMKIYIALFLSCASVLGADSSIQVVTKTFSAGHTDYKLEVFTRSGQTNLVCDTRTQAGALTLRIQSFYHDGLKIGQAIETPDSLEFVAESDSSYSLHFRPHSPHDAGSVYVSAKDGSVVDLFALTNGVYYPAEGHLIGEMSVGRKLAMNQATDSVK